MTTLSPKSSPPPELNPAKRLNPTSSPAKNSKTTNDPHLDALLSAVGLTPDDLLLTPEERADKSWKAFLAGRDPDSRRSNLPRVDLPDSLPEGYAGGSYIPGSGDKQFVYKMSCLCCGKHLDHETDDCPDKDTQEAKEFGEMLNANLQGL